MFVCVLCVCISAHVHVCICEYWFPWKPEALDTLEAVVVLRCQTWALEFNRSPLWEQCTLLIHDPSPHPTFSFNSLYISGSPQTPPSTSQMLGLQSCFQHAPLGFLFLKYIGVAFLSLLLCAQKTYRIYIQPPGNLYFQSMDLNS